MPFPSSAVDANDLGAPREGLDNLWNALDQLLPGRVSRLERDRISYARDMWSLGLLWTRRGRTPTPPDAVLWPETEDELARIVQLARTHHVPLIPFGAGSGVCGGTWALTGGLAVDLKRFEAIGPIDAINRTVEVGAGVMGELLERHLNERGYTLGHFPSSIYMSTVGGWIAARSAGQLSGKYGKIEDMTVRVRVVLGTGECLETPLRPQVGGDDAALLIGSEGTLCFFTGATLRVQPLPEARVFRAFEFDSLASGLEAMRLIFQSGLRPAAARLYDPFDTVVVARKHDGPHKKTPPSERGVVDRYLKPAALRGLAATSFNVARLLNFAVDGFTRVRFVLMFEGEKRRCEAEDLLARDICIRVAAVDLGPDPARRWFESRYDVSFRMSGVIDSFSVADTMEVACTWDKVKEVHRRVKEAVAPLAFSLCHFSHAYAEGCSLYFTFITSATGEGPMEERYQKVWAAALGAAIAAGSNVSHHHGIGLLKAEAYQRSLGGAQRLLVDLKRRCDPDGIMNPGKLGFS